MGIRTLITILFLGLFNSLQGQVNLIPKPLKFEIDSTYFFPICPLDDLIEAPKSFSSAYELLHLKLRNEVLSEFDTVRRVRNSPFVKMIHYGECFPVKSSYEIIVDSTGVNITASDEIGALFAVHSLHQIMLQSEHREGAVLLPFLKLYDSPRFPHRGLLLDCSRHFFSAETVKKYIDLLAFYKMNTLHWHLTEDQGWRIQIDKYPKLTEVGAWRTEKDGSRYGGFYTEEEIKQVVAYANERGVTVIPEIEMPGHSQAAIASYPHLSCTGEQVEVVNDWGVFKEIYCAGNDSVFTFLEDVLTEVMELFPSKYIHIGGDEAPKFRWEHCDKCQRRMADEGLKDEHELQSYFITRIEKFLNANGRELIGWDEILEGGLSPNASVQSWRGMEHGKHAAEQKHNVVMSPTSHCYLDYGLDAIDLEKVYSFNPIPKGLEKEFEQYILGAEVNMWTEHVPNDSVLDSRVFPRLIAMAEVLWSGPGGDYQDFYKRLQSHYTILEKMGVKYGLEAEPITVRTFVKKGKTYVEIIPGLPNLMLEYSLGDGLAYPYTKPFLLENSTPIQVMAYKNNILYGKAYETELVHHKALAKLPDYQNEYSPYYPAGGDLGLVDGLTGTLNFRDGRWQGFSGSDLEVVIDLGEEKYIGTVRMNFYEYGNAWILPPQKVTVFTSMNGQEWRELFTDVFDTNPDGSKKAIHEFRFNSAGMHATRYIKVVAINTGPLPAWHEAAGSDAWIFVDEIIVR